MSHPADRTRRSFLYAAGLVAVATAGFLGGPFDWLPPGGSAGHRMDAAVRAVVWEGDAPPPRSASRPLIGIASLNSENYIRAVRDAGGVPVVLPNTDGNTDRIAEYLQVLDGLLLPGGADIPPSEYGEEPHETVGVLDDDRYRFERDLSRAWIEQTDKPLLGICLGSQWINVASGGSLVQDIPSEYGVNHRGVMHPVQFERDTRLREIIGQDQVQVNSSHHQAVKRLGRNLKIAARSPDGVIEATETTDPQRFLIGVQWHPERLLQDDPRQLNLLRAFVDAAAGTKAPAGTKKPAGKESKPIAVGAN